MARRDTGRWVARAAATGGGRTYRGRRPVRWYSSLVLVVLLGLALIVYSRYELEHPASSIQPAIGTHWYLALAFDVCGTVEPDLPANPNETTAAPGLYTEGDGVLQVAPAKASDAGNNATLGRFVQEYPDLALSPSALRLPGKTTHHNGQSCPSGSPDAGKKAVVRVQVWPSFTSSSSFVPSDPTTLKLANEELITVSFLPADKSIPKPSTTVVEEMLQDQASSSTTTTTVPTTAPTTTVPTTTTTSGAATTTTTTPTTTTTTKS